MIVWISGAYGVGKSTLAEELVRLMGDAMFFDVEEVGNAVRGNYPGEPYGVIFEDYPLWAEFCCRLLADVHSKFCRNIFVPMTLLRRASYENIIGKISAEGIDVRFVVLEATRESLHDRILARGEDEDCWCMQNIDAARAGAHAIGEGLHLCTDGVSVGTLADVVLEWISEK